MNLLSGFSHGWQNVTNANGGTITIAGMLLVFFSLSVISIIIGLTPYLLRIINRYIPESEEEEKSKNSGTRLIKDNEIAAAISTALIYSVNSQKQ